MMNSEMQSTRFAPQLGQRAAKLSVTHLWYIAGSVPQLANPLFRCIRGILCRHFEQVAAHGRVHGSMSDVQSQHRRILLATRVPAQRTLRGSPVAHRPRSPPSWTWPTSRVWSCSLSSLPFSSSEPHPVARECKLSRLPTLGGPSRGPGLRFVCSAPQASQHSVPTTSCRCTQSSTSLSAKPFALESPPGEHPSIAELSHLKFTVPGRTSERRARLARTPTPCLRASNILVSRSLVHEHHRTVATGRIAWEVVNMCPRHLELLPGVVLGLVGPVLAAARHAFKTPGRLLQLLVELAGVPRCLVQPLRSRELVASLGMRPSPDSGSRTVQN